MWRISVLAARLGVLCAVAIASAPSVAEEAPAYEEHLKRAAELKTQADEKLAQATELEDAPRRSAQLKTDARGLLLKVQGEYTSAIAKVEASLKQTGERQLEATLVQLRLANALTTREIANTYPAADPQRAKVLRRAIDELETLHKTYRRNLAGLYARAFAADCYQDLGELEKALAIHGELLDLPSGQPAFEQLKKRSISRAMTCWLAPDPPDFKNAIWHGSRWLKATPELAADDADALAVHYHLAKAYLLRAGAAETRENRRTSLRHAAGNAQYVAKHSQEHGDDAKRMLREIPDDIVPATDESGRPSIEDIPSLRSKSGIEFRTE